MRLIDADAFIEYECNNCDGECEAIPCDCLNCGRDCRCDFIKDIEAAPTVEAEPVRHGHWIITDNKTHTEPIFNCSICGNFEAWGYTECYKYCPECGAKMDEVTE